MTAGVFRLVWQVEGHEKVVENHKSASTAIDRLRTLNDKAEKLRLTWKVRPNIVLDQAEVKKEFKHG